MWCRASCPSSQTMACLRDTSWASGERMGRESPLETAREYAQLWCAAIHQKQSPAAPHPLTFLLKCCSCCLALPFDLRPLQVWLPRLLRPQGQAHCADQEECGGHPAGGRHHAGHKPRRRRSEARTGAAPGQHPGTRWERLLGRQELCCGVLLPLLSHRESIFL